MDNGKYWRYKLMSIILLGNSLIFPGFEASYTNMPADGSVYQIDRLLNMTGDLSSMNGTNSCSCRMVRGANFGDPPRMLRSAYRNWAPGPGEQR